MAPDPLQVLAQGKAERREEWALAMARAVHVLRYGGKEDWRSFAATTGALVDGRVLATIPIMDYVYGATIPAWIAEQLALHPNHYNATTD